MLCPGLNAPGISGDGIVAFASNIKVDAAGNKISDLLVGMGVGGQQCPFGHFKPD
jgi:hypothetical protein